MAYIPAKIIERILSKECISVEGYYVIESINIDCIKEERRLGMDKCITDEFLFLSTYELEGIKLTFYVNVCKDYHDIYSEQEVPFYYIYLDSCKIEKDGQKEKLVKMEVFWK